ncbi:MAG: hypothetical protein IKM61_03540 [Eubacteriaceae bacterium]|nr:hypothetical protein [Eubacteriaceae bacterium]
MSRIIHIASDNPLEEYKNPHEQLLSVNEALQMGITDIHDFLLEDGFDRDKPGVILISDRDIVFNLDTGEVDDGGYDDDFSVFPTEVFEEMKTKRRYCALFQWPGFLPRRAERFAEYLKRQAENSGVTELWNVWLGSYEPDEVKTREISVKELSGRIIEEFFNEDSDECDVCYVIKR